jgi:hypothetical protein
MIELMNENKLAFKIELVQQNYNKRKK